MQYRSHCLTADSLVMVIDCFYKYSAQFTLVREGISRFQMLLGATLLKFTFISFLKAYK